MLEDRVYIRSKGTPIETIKNELIKLKKNREGLEISGVGVTGSGRKLIGMIIGADEIKNEITAHAVGTLHYYPDVSTILEIGGQDSKIIIIKSGVVVDFAMNTVCAAGTGSFLDQQASRLGLSIQEFSNLAMQSENPTKIAGRCGVFAESDMIHKQQMGYPREDIIAGLCDALVLNYLNNVGRGKKIKERVVFQGGVAANPGIKRSFEKKLGLEITIPEHYDIMGAIGVALIAMKRRNSSGSRSLFRGFDRLNVEIKTRSFECEYCSNRCEIIEILRDGRRDFCIGGKCNRYD
jgi:predicted CoA-substrate-specific enzyme activase